MNRFEHSQHHILERRSDWTSNQIASSLRKTSELTPEIWQPAHNELHRNCPIVPLLGYRALELVKANFEPANDNTMKSIDRLLCTINQVSNNPDMHIIERHLAELAMHSIELQVPYIRGNIIRGDK